jgi:hypothetical protein
MRPRNMIVFSAAVLISAAALTATDASAQSAAQSPSNILRVSDNRMAPRAYNNESMARDQRRAERFHERGERSAFRDDYRFRHPVLRFHDGERSAFRDRDQRFRHPVLGERFHERGERSAFRDRGERSAYRDERSAFRDRNERAKFRGEQ